MSLLSVLCKWCRVRNGIEYTMTVRTSHSGRPQEWNVPFTNLRALSCSAHRSSTVMSSPRLNSNLYKTKKRGMAKCQISKSVARRTGASFLQRPLKCLPAVTKAWPCQVTHGSCRPVMNLNPNVRLLSKSGPTIRVRSNNYGKREKVGSVFYILIKWFPNMIVVFDRL